MKNPAAEFSIRGGVRSPGQTTGEDGYSSSMTQLVGEKIPGGAQNTSPENVSLGLLPDAPGDAGTNQGCRSR
jgi:hypothetical protein